MDNVLNTIINAEDTVIDYLFSTKIIIPLIVINICLIISFRSVVECIMGDMVFLAIVASLKLVYKYNTMAFHILFTTMIVVGIFICIKEKIEEYKTNKIWIKKYVAKDKHIVSRNDIKIATNVFRHTVIKCESLGYKKWTVVMGNPTKDSDTVIIEECDVYGYTPESNYKKMGKFGECIRIVKK